MYVDLIILYKQFNLGLVPQTFGLVTLSNSLPEGQPHLFIFVSPCNSGCTCITVQVHNDQSTCQMHACMHTFCIANMFLKRRVKMLSAYIVQLYMEFLVFQILSLDAHLIVNVCNSGTRRTEDVEVTAKREFRSRTEASQ